MYQKHSYLKKWQRGGDARDKTMELTETGGEAFASLWVLGWSYSAKALVAKETGWQAAAFSEGPVRWGEQKRDAQLYAF